MGAFQCRRGNNNNNSAAQLRRQQGKRGARFGGHARARARERESKKKRRPQQNAHEARRGGLFRPRPSRAKLARRQSIIVRLASLREKRLGPPVESEPGAKAGPKRRRSRSISLVSMAGGRIHLGTCAIALIEFGAQIESAEGPAGRGTLWAGWASHSNGCVVRARACVWRQLS